MEINYPTYEDKVRAGGAKEFVNVPQSCQTYEMCLRAVMDNPAMISRIRPDLLTNEIKAICGIK